MNQIYFIGVDISKEKIDVSVINRSCQVLLEKIIANKRARILSYLEAICRKFKVSKEEILICCEETGVYTTPLKEVCTANGFSLWVENAYKIKKAASDFRGKSDRKDAQRIAEYALRYSDKQFLYQQASMTEKTIQTLLGARETLLLQINAIKQQLSESKSFDPTKHSLLNACYRKTLKTLKAELKRVEEQIECAAKADQLVQNNLELLTSIPGIGKQNALNLIVFTKNFAAFKTAAHLACYAGVVPFPNQSGGMVKRDRVSKFANKNIKKLLHMAAMATVRMKGELRDYYLRKVQQGKNKMLVLNAVRNKLVHRVFAVIQRQTPYEIKSTLELSIN